MCIRDSHRGYRCVIYCNHQHTLSLHTATGYHTNNSQSESHTTNTSHEFHICTEALTNVDCADDVMSIFKQNRYRLHSEHSPVLRTTLKWSTTQSFQKRPLTCSNSSVFGISFTDIEIRPAVTPTFDDIGAMCTILEPFCERQVLNGLCDYARMLRSLHHTV